MDFKMPKTAAEKKTARAESGRKVMRRLKEDALILLAIGLLSAVVFTTDMFEMRAEALEDPVAAAEEEISSNTAKTDAETSESNTDVVGSSEGPWTDSHTEEDPSDGEMCVFYETYYPTENEGEYTLILTVTHLDGTFKWSRGDEVVTFQPIPYGKAR